MSEIEKDKNPLLVTRGGVPCPDQKESLREFMDACEVKEMRQAKGHDSDKAASLTVGSYALINELLAGATPMGAYCMGAATTACLAAGQQPGRALLLWMREATSPAASILPVDVYLSNVRRLKGKPPEDRQW